jgi:hypothetical protein
MQIVESTTILFLIGAGFGLKKMFNESNRGWIAAISIILSKRVIRSLCGLQFVGMVKEEM